MSQSQSEAKRLSVADRPECGFDGALCKMSTLGKCDVLFDSDTQNAIWRSGGVGQSFAPTFAKPVSNSQDLTRNVPHRDQSNVFLARAIICRSRTVACRLDLVRGAGN